MAVVIAAREMLFKDDLTAYCAICSGAFYSEKIVSVKFMKKYIHIAKSVKPVLTEEASAAIAEHYAKLRSYEKNQDDLARVSFAILWPLCAAVTTAAR